MPETCNSPDQQPKTTGSPSGLHAMDRSSMREQRRRDEPRKPETTLRAALAEDGFPPDKLKDITIRADCKKEWDKFVQIRAYCETIDTSSRAS